MPETWRLLHPVFHESLLTPYRGPSSELQRRPPPPEPTLVDDHVEYELEQVIDSRRNNDGTVQYLVAWKGYGHEEDKWMSLEELKNALDAVRDFVDSHPKKPNDLDRVEEPVIRPATRKKRPGRVRILAPSDSPDVSNDTDSEGSPATSSTPAPSTSLPSPLPKGMWRRDMFPADFFENIRRPEPLTTGIDYSIPGQVETARLVRLAEREAALS